MTLTNIYSHDRNFVLRFNDLIVTKEAANSVDME